MLHDVKFTDKAGKQEYVWATSWGVSTRLMGALVMMHSDDNGLVLPPKLAPYQVVIVPIFKTEEDLQKISKLVYKIKSILESKNISVKYDNRDTHKPGWKFAEHELKGVPIRLALGLRDLENDTVEIARRDTLEKETCNILNVENKILNLLEEIQNNLFNKALTFRNKKTYKANSKDEFVKLIEQGGFVYAHWDGTNETEQLIKQETKATIRCIPLDAKEEKGVCLFSGAPSDKRVLFAKNY